jgi:enoyl-CoA hydratase/carnithine racemase
VARANKDPEAKVVILQGAGNAFCTGYDLKIFAETPRPCPVCKNKKNKISRKREKEKEDKVRKRERKQNREVKDPEAKVVMLQGAGNAFCTE